MRKVAIVRGGIGLVVTLASVLATMPACATDDDRPRGAAGSPADPVIYAAGDSITAGGPPWALQDTSYPDALDAACGNACTVVNGGHAGACLLLEGCYYPTRLRKSLADEVWSRPSPPDIVIVMIGANDLGGFNPTEAYVDRLRGIRRDGRAVGARVLFGTITPAHEYWPLRCEEQRREINDWIREQPGAIDFASVLESRTGELRARFDSGDGLHPNSRAYRAMGRYAWSAING